MRQFRSAKAAQAVTLRRAAVEQGDVIVSALLVRFNLEHIEHEPDAMTGRGREMPDAVLLSRIQVGVVGR